MNVKNILGECLVKMGKKNFVENETYSDEECEIIEELLGALNVVYREIVCEYLPLIHSEEVTFANGRLPISALEKRILYPIRLFDVAGNSVNFKTYPDTIVAGLSGNFTLEYAYVPQTELGIDDCISDMRLTMAAISDGTLAEYYFANKVFDLARDFDVSYRNRMGILRYKGRRMRIKQRGWQD